MADERHWQVTTLTDPSAATEAAADLVTANPIAYSVFSTVTGSLHAEPNRYAAPRWYAVSDSDDTVVLVAMHTAPHPLHLPMAVPGAIAALADQIVSQGISLPGVNGPKAASEELSNRYLAATGQRIIRREGLGVYDLPVPAQTPWPIEGEHRLASESDLRLVASWVDDFLAETGDRMSDAETMARRQIRLGNVSLWIARDVPVSMCWASAPYSGVVRVSGVYTPPAERGNGYASGVVTAASRRQQDEGYTCMLYTELTNPTSNKIYRALGYRYLGEDLKLLFR
jgi:predicted GNAT family acetyltransferase